MDALRQYIFSIVAASMIAGIVMGFLQGGTVKTLVKLICGLFLAFMMISPIRQLDLSDFAITGTEEAATGENLAAQGEELAAGAVMDIIKQETEAYILDKAAALNASLEVQVAVSEEAPHFPVSVVLRGEVSPYAKRRLETMLAEELGISKENLQWTG